MLNVLSFQLYGVGPCKVLSPIFHRVSEMEDFKDIEFYDLDIDDHDNAELVNSYQIRNVPTVLCLDENNEIMKRIVGAVPEHQFISMLRDVLIHG